MNRRLIVGWSQVGVVLGALTVCMVLSGWVSRSTDYPTDPRSAPNLSATSTGWLTDPASSVSRQIPDKTAVLTFEGAPDPGATENILGLLKQEGVPATFFVTGSAAVKHADSLRSIADAGHEIGVGSFTYTDLRELSRWHADLELAATQATIVDATAQVASLVRPYAGQAPAGTTVETGVGPLAGYLVVPTGHPVRWDFPGAYDLIQEATPAGDEGVVVSLAANPAHQDQTMNALPGIISMLRDRGYNFETVSGAMGLSSQASMSPASVTETVVAVGISWAMSASVTIVDILGWLLLPLGVITVLRAVAVTVLALVQVRRKRRPEDQDAAFSGPVSIIVPAYNEEANIAATIGSLLASDYPDFEVIVVDDGSTDSTPDILREFADRVVLVRQSNAGKASALNNGISRAHHDVIVMVDGDTVFEPGTLRALVTAMIDPNVGAIAGNTKVVNRGGLLGRWQHIEYVVGMNLDRRMFELLDCMPTVPGAVGAFRREALVAVGGVPTRTLAEDTDLTMAINLNGWQIKYAGDAIAWTEAPGTAKALAQQRFRWCYGTLQAMWFHRRTMRPVRGPGTGHVGSRGIPYLVMFQVLQPLLAPVIDIYLLYAVLFIDPWNAAIIWLFFTALQLSSAMVAFRLDGESARCLWAVPTTQLFYRQLLYVVVIQSIGSAISGATLRWHQPPRTGAAAASMVAA